MKALVYNGPCDVSIRNVPDARVERPADASVEAIWTNICGSDPRMYEARIDMELAGYWGMKTRQPLRMSQALDAYRHSDSRDPGWTKVILKPAA